MVCVLACSLVGNVLQPERSNALKVNDFHDTDAQRQLGTRQVGSNIEPDRSGEPPIGQATAVAAAQFLTGTLGANQQQQQQVKNFSL